jgi:hypothetical protein
MSGARFCITNELADFRSCLALGSHRPTCDGRERYVQPVSGTTTALDLPCEGCMPREAEVGYLCYSHVAKFTNALDVAPTLVETMWNDRTNGVRDTNEGGGGGAAGPRWPLIESRILSWRIIASLLNAERVLNGDDTVDLRLIDTKALPADASTREARRYATAGAARLDLHRDDLLSTKRGSEAAVRFQTIVQGAYTKFPQVESSHRIAGIRCPKCHRSELVWRPPLMHRGDVVIKCDHCMHEEPQEWLEQYAAVLQLRPARGR